MSESLSTAAAADARASGYLKYLNKSSYIVRNLDNSAVEAYYDQRTPTVSHHSIPTQSFHQMPALPESAITYSHHSSHHHHHHPQQQQTTWSTHQVSGQQQQQVGPAYYSEMERLIREAPQPIETSSTREIVNLNGIGSGYLLNKAELDNWRGELPLDKYPLNTNFSDAEIVRKKLDKVHYVQEFGVRYLKPPAIQAPPIIIRERTSSVPPAPPLIIRQESDLSKKQKTLIFREHPPTPPHIPPVEIEVDGGKSGYHARRVVVEKMGKLPERPPNIIIEKWLQYRVPKRQVKFLRSSSHSSFVPRNLIIEWEAPGVKITRKCKDLGVHHQDPAEYVRLYGADLKNTNELPTCDDGRFNSSVQTTRPAAPAVVETRPAPPTFSTSSLRFVTQRPDCPCTSACTCQCHTGGYWTSNNDCCSSSQQVQAPAPVTTTTSFVQQSTFTSSSCCCEPQRAPTPLPPPPVVCQAPPPPPPVVQLAPPVVNNSTPCCCTNTGSFGGGGYYISEVTTGCCCETPAAPPPPVVQAPPPPPVVHIPPPPTSCTCCCTNTSLPPPPPPPVVNIPPPPPTSCTCCCTNTSLPPPVVHIPPPPPVVIAPPPLPAPVPQPSGDLCCCRSGVSNSATHLTDCHQMSAINGKCPIHYGNQYGSANYSTGSESRYNLPELVGDVNALALVADRLDQYGLGQYRDLVNRIQTTSSTRSNF